MSKEIEAGGGTIPAASIYTYYKDKKVFRTFGVVTDEEENGSYFSETWEEEDVRIHRYIYCVF